MNTPGPLLGRLGRAPLPLFSPRACSCGLVPEQPFEVFEENGSAPLTPERPFRAEPLSGCRAEDKIQALNARRGFPLPPPQLCSPKQASIGSRTLIGRVAGLEGG